MAGGERRKKNAAEGVANSRLLWPEWTHVSKFKPPMANVRMMCTMQVVVDEVVSGHLRKHLSKDAVYWTYYRARLRIHQSEEYDTVVKASSNSFVIRQLISSNGEVSPARQDEGMV